MDGIENGPTVVVWKITVEVAAAAKNVGGPERGDAAFDLIVSVCVFMSMGPPVTSTEYLGSELTVRCGTSG